jgi:thiosulfate/3-mercaptopyruvate sulfurtransferase
MRRILPIIPISVLAVVLAGASVAPVSAQRAASPRDAVVVTTAWVAAHLNDPDLVLLHVGSAMDYPAAHLPGARYVNFSSPGWSAPRTPGSLSLELPSPEDFRSTLAALGISDRSRIVVYQAKQNYAPATRAMVTLTWAGLGARTVLMDGGLDVWQDEGRPTTSALPTVTPGTLSPLKTLAIVASIEDVQRAQTSAGVKVIDARDVEYYDGTKEGGNQAARNRGHIPGALSVPYSSVYSDAGLLKTSDELAAIFKNAGVEPGDTVITYCHIGQQATSTLFAAQTLGFTVKLYDGSMDEWSLKKLPVETIKK